MQIWQNVCESDLRNIVKDYVEDKSNFIPKLWNLYNVVLTTNFDNNLVISKANIIDKSFTPLKKRKSISWVDYFFMDNIDIDILGLNLSDDEIDLWWILSHRAKAFSKLKKNYRKQKKNNDCGIVAVYPTHSLHHLYL